MKNQNKTMLSSENRLKTINIIREILYPMITLAVIFLCYYLLYSTNHFYPFESDGKTVLMIDAQSQYISYLRYMRNLLVTNGSFIYTGSKTFGGDFLSIYTYYLASPFNFLLVFFNEQSIPAFILITSIVKMMFGGLFMHLFLRSKTKNNSLFLCCVGVCYSLMAYSFVYQCNFMWLDAPMILPLVILGLEKLQKRKMKWLYPLSLAYALLCSWYTGAMVCIFVVLYFLVLFFSADRKENKKRKILDFILFSLAGGFIAGMWWVSAFLHFSGTKVQSSIPAFKWYSISTFLHGFLYDSYTSQSIICQNEGYIPAFTSLVMLVYSFHFFFNKGYKIKFKLLNFLLIGFYFAMSMNSVTYTLLHFGSVPTWFPSRYAFLYSFVICLYAFYQNEKMEKEGYIGYLIADMVIVGLIFVAMYVKDDSGNLHNPDMASIIIASIAGGVCLINLILGKITILKGKPKKYLINTVKCLAIPAAIYSSYIAGNKIITSNGNAYQNYSTYLDDDSYTNSVNILKGYDKDSLYRMEMTFNRDGNYNEIDNNPMFYSYNGLSHFSSSEIKEVEEYMTKIGFQYNGYFEKYDGGSTLSMNSFLGVKYLIDLEGNTDRNRPMFVYNEPFEEITEIKSDDKNIRYYQNTTALPLGFVVDDTGYSYVSEGKALGYGQTYWYDLFEYQNEIYREMDSSIGKDIFKPLDCKVTFSGMTLESSNVETKDYYYSGNYGSAIFVSFENPNISSPYNLYFCLKDCNQVFDIYIDGKKQDVYSYWHNGIRGISNEKKRHSILLYAKKAFTNEHIRLGVYYENVDTLKEYTTSLSRQASWDLKTSSSFFSYSYEGTFNLIEDDSMFLFTLPYEKDFSVYIDGEKAELNKKFNIFSGCSLRGYEKGKHTIKLVYQDKGLVLGFILSIFGILLLIFLILYIDVFSNHRRILTKNITN